MQRTRSIKKNQTIIYQGEATVTAYEITSGIIRAYTILSTGSEVNIALFGPGDYFPVEVLYESSPATLFYYETLTDAACVSGSAEELRSELAARPNTLASFNKRYVGALLHINALGQGTAYEKLAHTIRYLAMRFGLPLSGKGFVRIDMRLTQQDLANLANLSRETVSIELGRLKQKQAVVEKQKYYTVNTLRLNRLIGDEIVGDTQL